MIALDTDVLTEILLGNPVVVDGAATIPPHEQTWPIVVLEEIIRGHLQVIQQAEASQARVTLARAYDVFEQPLGDIPQVTCYRTPHKRTASIVNGVTNGSV